MLLRASLDLASAALSGGASLLASPARITAPPPRIIGTPGSATGLLGNLSHGDIAIDEAGSALLVADFAGGALRCVGLDGTPKWAATGFGAYHVAIDQALREVYAVDYHGGLVRVFNLDTGAALRSWSPGFSNPGCICVLSTDQVWVAPDNGSTVIREFDRAGSPTGRSVTAPADSIIAMFVSSVAVYIGIYTTPAALMRLNIAGGSPVLFGSEDEGDGAIGTISPTGSYMGSLAGDEAAGLLVHWAAEPGPLIDGYDLTPTPTRRYAYPGVLPGQIAGMGGAAPRIPGIALSASWMAYRSDRYSYAVASRLVSRARFSYAPGVAGVLVGLDVAGELGRSRDATHDMRKTKTFYSLDGGATRAQFDPGVPLSVSVGASQVVVVDVDMATFATAAADAVAPYFRAVSAYYDDGVVHYSERPSSKYSILIAGARENSMAMDFTVAKLTALGLKPICIGEDYTLRLGLVGDSGPLDLTGVHAQFAIVQAGLVLGTKSVHDGNLTVDDQASARGYLSVHFGQADATVLAGAVAPATAQVELQLHWPNGPRLVYGRGVVNFLKTLSPLIDE